ncbi:MAG: hypothetical protein ACKOSS_06100 [Planctomycetia bacterium]
MGARLPARAARRTAVVAAAPAFCGALVAAFGSNDSVGHFQAGVAMLVAAASAFAFLPLTRRQATAALAFGGVLAGALLLALGQSLVQSLRGAALVVAAGLCAQGLAALGRALGAGRAGAGTGALAVSVASLTGLWWADAAAAAAPVAARFTLRQAVLDLDLCTALAYDAIGLDRLLQGPVYDAVPLASSSVARPSAVEAAGWWGAVGLLAALAALLLERLAARRLARRSIGP